MKRASRLEGVYQHPLRAAGDHPTTSHLANINRIPRSNSVAVPHTYHKPLALHLWNRSWHWCQECVIDSWLLLPEIQLHWHRNGKEKKGTEVEFRKRLRKKLLGYCWKLPKLPRYINESSLHLSSILPHSTSSVFVLVSKLPKILSNPLNMRNAHPFFWQHTLHTDKSKITSKSCFTFQTWSFYCNQHTARRRVRLLNYNHKHRSFQAELQWVIYKS